MNNRQQLPSKATVTQPPIAEHHGVRAAMKTLAVTFLPEASNHSDNLLRSQVAQNIAIYRKSLNVSFAYLTPSNPNDRTLCANARLSASEA